MEASLGTIALRHGTDKAEAMPVRRIIPVYEHLLEPRRHQPISLLEIGILDGASLRTWREYFSDAKILAVDIDPTAAEHGIGGVTVLIGDQGDPVFLSHVAEYGPFDVVIDDGSHYSDDQRTSLAALWPVVNPGGVYVVEDIHTSYLGQWHGGYRKTGTFVEHVKEIVDDANQWWHQQRPTLSDLESVQVYPELCVFTKQATPFRGGGAPDPQRLKMLNQPITEQHL
jgi:predicted O-methyltransferase YrrM